MFKRESFEKKGILKDEKSIKGVVNKTAKKLVMGDILAYNYTEKKWVKFDNGTHGQGGFLLGIVKSDVDVTEKDTTIAILTQGEVAKEDVKEAKNNEVLVTLLAIQGIYLM